MCGLLRIVDVRIISEDLNGFAELADGCQFIPFFLIDMRELLEERDAAGTGGQVLSQQGLGQPVILAPDRLVRERLESLSRSDQTSEPKMESGKQPAGFGVLRIECEQFFKCRGRPAVLAGIHVRDRFLEQRTLLAVSDDTPLVHS